MKKMYRLHQKYFRKWLVGECIGYPSSYLPGHKLEKPSKESSIFQSQLAPSILFFFTKRQSQRRGGGKGHGTMPH